MRSRTVRSGVAIIGAVVVLGVACGDSGGGGPKVEGAAAQGQQVAAKAGCAACHSADGSGGVGPTWKGVWGAEVPLEDGGTTTFDADYVERAVREPQAERRAGASGQMPVFDAGRISDADLASVVTYLQALGDTP